MLLWNFSESETIYSGEVKTDTLLTSVACGGGQEVVLNKPRSVTNYNDRKYQGMI